MEIKTLGVVLLALFSIVFAYSFLSQDEGGAPSSYAGFVNDLSSADKVFIMMDLRNASPGARTPIMQCGVDLAGSEALAPRNISVLVMGNESCIFQDVSGESNRTAFYSAFYCEELSKSGVAFHIVQGNATSFYKNKIIIGIGENYSTPCKVTAKLA